MLNYEKCKMLKELGFPQKKYRYAKYYLTPELVIDFETAHDVFDNNRKVNDIYEEIDWTLNLVYIPTLEDLIGEQSYELTINAAANQMVEFNKLNNPDVAKAQEKDSQLPAPEAHLTS